MTDKPIAQPLAQKYADILAAAGGSPAHNHKFDMDCNVCVRKKLNECMMLLAECELHIDEWNFPITLGDRVKAACDSFYGDVRPCFDT